MIVGLVLLLGLGTTAPLPVAAASDTVDAKAAIAVDASTGQVLSAQNAHTALPIASMSKLLSIYLVRKAIQTGTLKWTDTYSPDANLVKISTNTALSNVAMSTKTKYTVRTLYDASLIYSANAAVMLLGSAVAGSQTKFVAQMNAQLKAWGITDAHVINASGLVNKEIGTAKLGGTTANDENKMSAADMAKVAYHLLKDYPDVLKTTGTRTATFAAGTADATKMTSWNLMLKGQKDYSAALPVDGLKTGTGDAAGDCFVGTVKKNGLRLITVVMHANGKQSDRRFIQTAKLMTAVYKDWHVITLPAGSHLPGAKTVRVQSGKQATVSVATAKAISLVVPSAVTAKAVTANWVRKRTLQAKVKAGAKAGTADLVTDTAYLQGTAPRVTLVTTKTVRRGNPFALIWRGVQEYFGGLF